MLLSATGATPLHTACCSGDVSELKKAISKATKGGIFRREAKDSFNPDVQDSNGMTPLMLATARGHLDAVTYLMEKCTTKPNLNMQDILGWTALHHGVNEAQLHVVVYLIDKGAELIHRTKQAETLLHLLIKSAFASSKTPYEALISKFAKTPGIVDAINDQGETALHIACSQGNEKAVVCLLESSSDPNAKNGANGDTPLHTAVRLAAGNPRHVRLLSLLLNYGAHAEACNNDGATPLSLATDLGAPSQVVEIMKACQGASRGSPSMRSVQGSTRPRASGAAANTNAMMSQLKTSIRLQKQISKKVLKESLEDGPVKRTPGTASTNGPVRKRRENKTDTPTSVVVKKPSTTIVTTTTTVTTTKDGEKIEETRTRSKSIEGTPIAAEPAAARVSEATGPSPAKTEPIEDPEAEQASCNRRKLLLQLLRCQASHVPPTLQEILESQPTATYQESFLLDCQRVRIKDEVKSDGHSKFFNSAIQIWKPVTVQRIPYNFKDETNIKHMFEDEIDMLKQVHHPHLVSYFGCTIAPSHIDVVMEQVQGGSVADLLAEEKIFSERFSANILVQVLEGLMYLHKRKIAHKSLILANIQLTPDGKVKLSDYLSSSKILFIEEQKRTNPEFSISHPNHSAPEVVNEFAFSTFSDIWSLGSCLIEMVTGKPPFNDYEGEAVVVQVSECTSVPLDAIALRKLTNLCQDILNQCFKFKPEERSPARLLAVHDFIKQNIVPEGNLYQTLANFKQPSNSRAIEEEVKAYQRQLDEGLKWLSGALDNNQKRQANRFNAYLLDLINKIKSNQDLKDYLQPLSFHFQYAEQLKKRYENMFANAAASTASTKAATSTTPAPASAPAPVTPTMAALNTDDDDDEYDDDASDGDADFELSDSDEDVKW